MKFELVLSDDEPPTIMRGDETIGRALTRRDGEAIVEALNEHAGTDFRDRLLAEVTDAVENCFEGAT